MEEIDRSNLDAEYKRYLQIMRPYLGQLHSEDVIQICNAWIQRLSTCRENEKMQRNKYVFSLCYQLAKGILDYPFTRYPPADDLNPLNDDVYSEESSTEVEYLVINPDTCTNVLYSNQRTPLSTTEYVTNTNPSISNFKDPSDTSCNSTISPPNRKFLISPKQTFVCFNSEEKEQNTMNDDCASEKLEFRANNIIIKLRQMKQENLILRKEIMMLKEAKLMDVLNDSQIYKVDNCTSTYFHFQESNTNLNSLKSKLQELQDSRNSLIESVGILQEKLDNFNDLKRHEIEELEATHKLNIIQIKTSIREEDSRTMELKIDDMKRYYEDLIKNMQKSYTDEIETLTTKLNKIMEEKEKSFQLKDNEITQLNNCIENMKCEFTKLSNQTAATDASMYCEKVNELEKRLHKMEKLKQKCARAYEFKIANLQRDKHLNECSLQLQLIKQRSQVVSEVTDENQVELSTALEKLEGKYKDIIANVQTAAMQRRIHDQMALESLIKAISDIPHEGKSKDNKIYSNVNNQQCDNNNKTSYTPNKFGTVIVGNSTIAEQNVGNGYYINNNKLEEIFEKINIPQKDTNHNHLGKL